MNRVVYKNGDRVDVAVNGDVNNIVLGTVVGLASNNIIDHWLVNLDKRLPGNVYPYDAVSFQHTFIRLRGDNKPFLCEIGKFDYDE